MDGEDESVFHLFDMNETFIFMSKFSMKACPQINHKLVIPRKEGHNFSYHVPKRPKVKKKIYFLYSKAKISKRTQTENIQLMDFCETNHPTSVQVF